MRQTIRTGLVGSTLAAGMLGLAVGPVHAQLQDQTQIRPTNDLPGPYERVHLQCQSRRSIERGP